MSNFAQPKYRRRHAAEWQDGNSRGWSAAEPPEPKTRRPMPRSGIMCAAIVSPLRGDSWVSLASGGSAALHPRLFKGDRYAVVAFVLLFFIFLAVGTMEPASANSGQLNLTVVDGDTGKPIPCRIHLVGPNKKPYKVEKAPYWQDHFVITGKYQFKLPLGYYTFVIERGLEYRDQTGNFTLKPFADDATQIEMHRFADMAAEGWWSGDLDVRRPLGDLELLMDADDLHVAEAITWNNDKSQWTGKNLPKDAQVRFDGNRYYDSLGGSESNPGGEVLFYHLPAPLKLAKNAGEYPPLAKHIKEAKNQAEVWVDLSRPFWWDMPELVALGLVDSIQIAHGDLCRESVVPHETGVKPRDKTKYPNPWGNPQWSQWIYFQLLECGLHVPPSAGSSSGVAPNPVGYNRMYVHVDGEFSIEKWWQNFRAGQVVVTNGPLMRPAVNGEPPGYVFHGDPGQELEFEIGLTFSTRDPITYLEIIKNGKVEHSVRFDDYAGSGKLPTVKFDKSGWFLIRAVNDVGKTYRFAMTAPYYVEIGYQPRVSKKAAQFFLDWVVERSKQIKLDDPEQQREVMEFQNQARDYWKEKVEKATVE